MARAGNELLKRFLSWFLKRRCCAVTTTKPSASCCVCVWRGIYSANSFIPHVGLVPAKSFPTPNFHPPTQKNTREGSVPFMFFLQFVPNFCASGFFLGVGRGGVGVSCCLFRLQSRSEVAAALARSPLAASLGGRDPCCTTRHAPPPPPHPQPG